MSAITSFNMKRMGNFQWPLRLDDCWMLDAQVRSGPKNMKNYLFMYSPDYFGVDVTLLKRYLRHLFFVLALN